MGRDRAGLAADELIMDLTERECRSALLMLAHATTSPGGDDADNDDPGLNPTQAAVAENAARTAILMVLEQTRSIAIPAPALEVTGQRRIRPAAAQARSPRKPPGGPDMIA
jgi:hypothetical protein